MKQSLLTLSLFMSMSLNAQYRVATQEQVYEKYAPSVEVGRTFLPAMLCFIGGAMPADTQRGRIVQQSLFYGAGISIGIWETKKPKYFWIRAGAGLLGAAAGFAIRPR